MELRVYPRGVLQQDAPEEQGPRPSRLGAHAFALFHVIRCLGGAPFRMPFSKARS